MDVSRVLTVDTFWALPRARRALQYDRYQPSDPEGHEDQPAHQHGQAANGRCVIR